MNQYIAFLRAINVSGKNKISMSELKVGFEEIGFGDVVTYLNSGNVIFSDVLVLNFYYTLQVDYMVNDEIISL